MTTAPQYAVGAMEPCLLATDECHLAYRLLYHFQRLSGVWVRYAVVPHVIDERGVGGKLLATDVQLLTPPVRHQVNKVLFQRCSLPAVESPVHGGLTGGRHDIHVGGDGVRSLVVKGVCCCIHGSGTMKNYDKALMGKGKKPVSA